MCGRSLAPVKLLIDGALRIARAAGDGYDLRLVELVHLQLGTRIPTRELPETYSFSCDTPCYAPGPARTTAKGTDSMA